MTPAAPGIDGAGFGASDAQAQRSCARGAEPFGLVQVLTSDKDSDPRDLSIDRHESRLKRLRKTIRKSAGLLSDQAQNGFRTFLAMLTVTYGPGVEWSPYHITELQKRIRYWMNVRGFPYAYIWVCELQQRGAPHYHIVIWIPYGRRLPKPDEVGWWPHGMTKIEGVKRSAIGYLMKYLSKGRDDIARFAKGQRTHGSGGLTKASKQQRRWWMAPKFVRDRFPEWQMDVAPAPGGGWVARETGEWVASPWKIVCIGKSGVVVRWIAGPAIGVYLKGES